MATDVRAAEVEYPTSDGKPMAESDTHYRLLVDTRERLAARYADRPDVYVSGNLMVFYQPGNKRVFLSPDTFVAFGVPAGPRPLYKTWEEGKAPDVVFEFTSKTTRKADLGKKLEVYRDVWGVQEYFLFDPLDEYLQPPLRGFHRAGDDLLAMTPAADGSLASRLLGLTLHRQGTHLALRDAVTGEELLTPDQRAAAEASRAIAEARRAEAEAARAVAAEAEVARLRAELAALRDQP